MVSGFAINDEERTVAQIVLLRTGASAEEARAIRARFCPCARVDKPAPEEMAELSAPAFLVDAAPEPTPVPDARVADTRSGAEERLRG